MDRRKAEGTTEATEGHGLSIYRYLASDGRDNFRGTCLVRHVHWAPPPLAEPPSPIRPLGSDLRDQLQTTLGAAYVIDRELGGGGMSRVFVATEIALRREVVIKVLPSELVAGVNVERFRREILLAAGLQHPHIVPVLAAGEMDGLPWFTMPFVQGESLRQRLARGRLSAVLSGARS